MTKRRTTEQKRMENTMARPLANARSYMAARSSHERKRMAPKQHRWMGATHPSIPSWEGKKRGGFRVESVVAALLLFVAMNSHATPIEAGLALSILRLTTARSVGAAGQS